MKITLEEQKKGQELYNKLVQKAWQSTDFKEQLINDPKTTITGVLGKDFKGSVVVEDQSDINIIYLNIPRRMNIEDFELTDEQLELVSGGGWLGAAIGGLAGAAAGFVVAGPVGLVYGMTAGGALGAAL